MQADYNPPLIPGRPGRWLLTCRTAECGLRAVTLCPDQLPLTDAQAADYRERNAAREAFPNRR
jgi:hypothetical protein